MARQEKKPNPEKIIRDIQNINKIESELVNSNSGLLNGDIFTRQDELGKIRSSFNSIIKNDINNLKGNKNHGDSTYDFLSKALFGIDNKPNKQRTQASIDGDYNDKLKKLFVNTDTQISGFFLSNNSNYIALCDEIESICAYLPQLEEAIDIIRDNVLTCEEVSQDIAMNVSFGATTEDTSAYAELVKNLGVDYKIPKKLSQHIVPKAIKFGSYYVLTLPYDQISFKLSTSERNVETRLNSLGGSNKTGVLEGYMSELTSMGESGTLVANTIKKNLGMISINESEIPVFEEFAQFSNLDDKIKKAIKEANEKKTYVQMDKRLMRQGRGKNTSPEGTMDPNSQMETFDLPGCHIKMLDPRQIIPIKIFDHVLGYYYFENFRYDQMGTSLTEMLSNQFNFNEKNTVIDNIADSITKTLKYGDLVKADDKFKSLVLNALLYKEGREDNLKIKFLPAEYVTEFCVNEDEKGNGRPVLLRSLFFARLYVSLLLFNISTLVTKSTDTEFYYLKRASIDKQISNQVDDIIDQIQMSNMDPTAIVNGDLLSANRAINKRYFMSLGTEEIKPFEIDVIPGQNVDLHNDFLKELLKMAISTTGVPSVMIDFIDEVEYATMLNMANLKHLKRCVTIQTDLNPALSELYRKIVKFSDIKSIPDEMVEKLSVTLKKPKTIENNYNEQTLNSVQNTVAAMIELKMGGTDSELTEQQSFIKEELLKLVTMEQTQNLPWGAIERFYDTAIINATNRVADKKKSEAQSNSEEV